MNIAEIEELKLQVERKYGKVLGTSTDFYDFSLVMERLTGNHISPSTLKRMWGYVNDTHKPRRLTLDLLSRYLDYEDYQAFLRWLKTNTKYNSSFFSARQLISSEQATGTTIEISKTMSANPRRIGKIEIIFNMPDRDFSEKEKTMIERAAHTCPVHLSLHPDTEQVFTFKWSR